MVTVVAHQETNLRQSVGRRRSAIVPTPLTAVDEIELATRTLRRRSLMMNEANVAENPMLIMIDDEDEEDGFEMDRPESPCLNDFTLESMDEVNGRGVLGIIFFIF